MKKKIQVRISSREKSDGYYYTEVRTAKHILGFIHLLEDDNFQWRYSVELPDGYWLIDDFETEIEAIERLITINTLRNDYKTIELKVRDYLNSERGAITSKVISEFNAA